MVKYNLNFAPYKLTFLLHLDLSLRTSTVAKAFEMKLMSSVFFCTLQRIPLPPFFFLFYVKVVLKSS